LSVRSPRWKGSRQAGKKDARLSISACRASYISRTFLAWIRTALALVAAGVALEAFALPLQPALRFTAAMILLALGLVVPTLAWFTWTSVERALRESAPLPSSRIALPLAIGVSIVAALLVASVLLR
jgi:putative membrane protein